ncbi:ABC-type molybdate transport system substrate-binding protein [Psychrobacter luti]|uniref:ABC-type molybdate transport system substrate-binding protein n=1 Tax=Psychrobacter luti TaxID=198481 RepID=A0A839T9M6_9GAMM|nr:hypothetical protein [Psychrobacter luti]MBB3105839.1 ABC-type molybdate transport system substrate-binding protein [Psychrobacter luti]
MKDYKLLLAGLILLLLIIFIAIFTWLWTSNRKNMDPLPIMANDKDASTAAADDENAIAKSTLHIQAEDNIKVPLDAIITSFQSRYPHVQVVTSYVSAAALLTLSDSEFSDSHRTDDERASYVVNTDIIIANSKLSKERLSPLQEQLKAAQDKYNQSKVNNSAQEETAEDGLNENNETDTEVATQAKSDNTDTRSLISFSYALQDTQAVDGVVLTQNPAAINFRNFLLSSAGQDILSQHDYNNIDGYKNDMDNLFKPSSSAKQATGELKVDVADALSNGK